MFQIILNDGKQDRLLMASDFLRKRLMAITMARSQAGYPDTTPTLMDVEKTHVLFMNAHFKPFCAIGFEYMKVRANTGNPDFGSTIQFSIPQYGDFIFDMFAYVKMAHPTLIPDSSNTDPSNWPLMQWCPWIGERFFSKVDFTVNGNPMDTYYSWTYNMWRQARVGVDKIAGYARCMGQEVAEQGFVDQPNWADSGVSSSAISSRFGATTYSGLQTPSGQKTGNFELLIPLLFWFNLDPRLAIPSIAIPYGQRFINCTISPGNQLCDLVPRGTYAGNWASPGGSLNYSNCVQEITLYINNIFVNKEIHDIFIHRIGFNLIRVHQYQQYTVTTDQGSILLNGIKWPVEWGQMGFRPKSYTDPQDANRRQYLAYWDQFSLVTPTARTATGWVSKQRVRKTGGDYLTSLGVLPVALTGGTTGFAFNVSAADTGAQLTLSAITFVATPELASLAPGDEVVIPLSSISGAAISVTPSVTLPASVTLHVAAVNLTTGVVTFVESVHQFLVLLGAADPTYTWTTLQLLASQYASSTANISVYSFVQTEQSVTVDVKAPTVASVKLTAAGVTILDEFPQSILSSYYYYNYGGAGIKTPTDPGLMMLNFCLFPTAYQPSGHFNFSRCREFMLNFTGSIFSNSVQGTFLIETSNLNFLLISDGSAVLRYTT